jgi:hypothetical protein
MTGPPPPFQIVPAVGIKEMTRFERACFVLIMTSLIVLVAASAAFLTL